MAKINITKKTGTTDSLSLISAFKVENNTYIVFDSERTGSMGLPVIYVSKLTDHLEKITDDNEWQSVKNYLKGIINGTNFEYVSIEDNLTADEAYYKELSLPNQDSFNAIKNRYLPADKVTEPTPIEPTLNVNPVNPVNQVNQVNPTPVNIPPVINEPTPPVAEPVIPVVSEVVPNTSPTEPIIPSAPASAVQPEVPPVVTPSVAPVESKEPTLDLSADKETFLKACENMFDALASKYQKALATLSERERALNEKEQQVTSMMEDANEHLRNAEAREQVANIAHDNAQRIMDMSNFMPTNPNPNSNPDVI